MHIWRTARTLRWMQHTHAHTHTDGSSDSAFNIKWPEHMPVSTHWQLRARLWWETVGSLFFQALKNASILTRHLFLNWVLKGLHYGNSQFPSFMHISPQRCFMKALLNLLCVLEDLKLLHFQLFALLSRQFQCNSRKCIRAGLGLDGLP